MVRKWILVGIAVTCAGAAHAFDGAPQKDGQVGLSCTGLMVAGDLGPPGGAIITRGNIDFAAMQVRGFGIGSVPVLSVSAREVRFGTAPAAKVTRGQIVEGRFDRESGETRVLVRAAKSPYEPLIEMNLGCRVTAPVS